MASIPAFSTVWALFRQHTPTGASRHAGPALKFALDAVAVLQELIGSLTTESGIESSMSFLVPLVPELASVYERLEQFASSGNCVPGSDGEKRIVTLLTVLERLVSWPRPIKPSPSPSGLPSSSFARVDYVSLHNLVSESQDTGKNDNLFIRESQTKTRCHILELARSFKERAAKDRWKILASLTAFSGKEIPEKGLPLSKILEINALESSQQLKKDRERLRNAYASCLRLLHAALHKCSPQAHSCGGGFTTNIALGRVKRLDETHDEVLLFDCFFLHPHLAEPKSGGDWWKKAQLKVFLQSERDHPSTARRVHFGDHKSGSVVLSDGLCSLIRDPVAGRLLLTVISDSLVYDDTELTDSDDDEDREFLEYDPSVSLATMLKKCKLQDARHRLLLSYLLAKAVWQFYESDWMTPSWTTNAIHFMRERLYGQGGSQDIITLLHKPYFTTAFGASSLPRATHSVEPGHSRETHPTHCQPKILALGIMLLEIGLGKTIDEDLQETFRRHERKLRNDEHSTAWRITQRTEKLTKYQALREIIQSCIRPDRGKFGKLMDEEEIRDSLYANVVAPLETLCKQAWHQEGEPELFDPEPIQFKTAELPSSRTETVQVQLDPGITVSVIRDSPEGKTRSPCSSPRTRSSPNAHADSSQPRDAKEPSTSQGKQSGADIGDGGILAERNTDKWFSKFQRLQKEESGGRQTIKIAVLDSGIDLSYAGIRDADKNRIQETKTFIDSKPEEDRTGHGTLVAAIILRLTEGRNVKLYIGKITDSHRVDGTEKIAKAIGYARTEWNVDIISLSFGFQNPQPLDRNGTLVDPMEEAVKACINDNVIVFASASNDGGEGRRTYPAMYPGVICVHAADYLGNPSRINPNPLEKADNFSFVGEQVRPTWSLEDLTNDHQSTAYVSGTSFATPVAVSIAVFMFGYINKQMKREEWRIQPKSSQGITEIFRIMAETRNQYEWVSPTSYFDKHKNAAILANLRQTLGWPDLT